MFFSVVVCAFLYAIFGIRRYGRIRRYIASWILFVAVFAPLFAVEIFAALVAHAFSRTRTGAQQLLQLGSESENPLVKKVSEVRKGDILETLYHLQLDIGHTLLQRTRANPISSGVCQSPNKAAILEKCVQSNSNLQSGVSQTVPITKAIHETPSSVHQSDKLSRGAILLIHGYSQNFHTWHTPGSRSLPDYLAQEGFDVFCIDLRGSIRSQKAGAVSPLGVSCFIENDIPRAIEAIKDLTKLQKVTLVGHSMGAAIACAVAGRVPESVNNVVAIAGVYSLMHGTKFLRLVCSFIVLFVRLLRIPRQWCLPTDRVGKLLYVLRNFFDKSLVKSWIPIQAWDPGSLDEDVLGEFLWNSFEPMSVGVSVDVMTMMWGNDLLDTNGKPYFEDFESRTDLSLLVMAGTADLLVSPDDSLLCYHRAVMEDKQYVVFCGKRPWSDQRHEGDSKPTSKCEINNEATFGHVDIILGDHAVKLVWPRLTRWLKDRSL